MAERRQLGARADRAEHPARAPSAAAQPSATSRAIRAPASASSSIRSRDAVLAQVREVGAEGVGLDAVGARLEVGVVDRADDVGPRDVEDLVAALVPVGSRRGRGRAGLEHRAHRAVGDDDALGEHGALRAACSVAGFDSQACSGILVRRSRTDAETRPILCVPQGRTERAGRRLRLSRARRPAATRR